MSKQKFDVGQILNDQSKKEIQARASFAVQRIPIDRLKPSPDNFYGIRNVPELAADIELHGLMQNLVVLEPDADGMYEIIGGERRWTACKMLFEGGNEAFRTVPCIVQHAESRDAVRLMLIQANATTRELTDFERVEQVRLTRETLQNMKENGEKFPGRMREEAARILGMSPAHVGRMESIDRHLSPELKAEMAEGNLRITEAYELSTLPEEGQAAAMEELRATGAVDVKKHREKKERKPKPAEELPVVEQREEPAAAEPQEDAGEEPTVPKMTEIERALAMFEISVFIDKHCEMPRKAEDIGRDILRAAGVTVK